MGRGRAKAKQQKVARDLKYNAHPTDLTALQRELTGSSGGPHGPSSSSAYDDELADDDSDEADGSDDWATASR
jgi:hypothetical protein